MSHVLGLRSYQMLSFAHMTNHKSISHPTSLSHQRWVNNHIHCLYPLLGIYIQMHLSFRKER